MTDQQVLRTFNIIVVGAGFGGLAAAIELASRGATVKVFEVYGDTKKQGMSRFKGKCQDACWVMY